MYMPEIKYFFVMYAMIASLLSRYFHSRSRTASNTKSSILRAAMIILNARVAMET